MRIQYASDLHLNDYPSTTPFSEFLTPSAPLLILAGDICPVEHPLYADFLRWCSRNWSQVLVISGNHEYFIEQIPQSIDQIDRCIVDHTNRLPNVMFLQGGDSVVIRGIRFVGATLWSSIDPAIADEVENTKGDFVNTYMGNRHTTVQDLRLLHNQHSQTIRNVLSKSNEPVVMITHHLPSYFLVSPEYMNDRKVSCYASHDDTILDTYKSKIRVWICGHAHRSGEWTHPTSGILCTMNCRGYASQTTGYSPSKTLDVVAGNSLSIF